MKINELDIEQKIMDLFDECIISNKCERDDFRESLFFFLTLYDIYSLKLEEGDRIYNYKIKGGQLNGS